MDELKYITYFVALIVGGIVVAIGGFFLPVKIRIRTVLFGVLSLFVGLFLTSSSLFLSELRISLESKHWQVTDGEIVNSKVSNKDYRPNLSMSRKRGGKRFQVLYEFIVNEKTFEGTRLSLGGVGGDSGEWEALKETYRPGSEVSVYYNPEDPSESVLIRNPSYGWIFLVLSAVFFYFSFRIIKGIISPVSEK